MKEKIMIYSVAYITIFWLGELCVIMSFDLASEIQYISQSRKKQPVVFGAENIKQPTKTLFDPRLTICQAVTYFHGFKTLWMYIQNRLSTSAASGEQQ